MRRRFWEAAHHRAPSQARTRLRCPIGGLFLWVCAFMGPGAARAPADVPIGLSAVARLDAASLLRPGVRTYQYSSHEPNGGNDDQGHYLQTIGGEDVLFDVKGPGCIYRLWWTNGNAYDPALRTIRIHFDGATSPQVNMSMAQFFSGSQGPFLSPLVGNNVVSSGGFYCYLPMPFRAGCRITLSGGGGPPNWNWYNITYQRFADASGVTTFTGQEDSTAARNVWNAAGSDPKPDQGTTTIGNTISVTNGSTATLASVTTGGTIQQLQITIPGLTDAMLTSVNLRAQWDGAATWAIDVPIGYFFGCGLGVRNVRGLPVGTDSATKRMYCYLPMPFANSALVQLVNNSGQTLSSLRYSIRYTPQASGLEGAGYLNAEYLSEVPTVIGRDYTILNETGGGHFIGVVQGMRGPDLVFLEGDERVYVDGSLTPQLQGTGTEDFYNGGSYFDHGTFSLPVHGEPFHVVQSGDSVGVYRFLLSDLIPFTNSIKVDIEHNGNNDGTPNYYSVAFYYKAPQAVSALTDTLDVGNAASESTHGYAVSSGTWSGSTTGYYEGDDDTVPVTDDGRRHAGESQFVAAVDPANGGLLLRRRMDYSLPRQDARVYVDGTLAGEWYEAGSNNSKIFRDSEFMVPAWLTHNKSSTTIRIVNASSESNWTEYTYWVYSLAPDQELSIDMGSSDVVSGLTRLEVAGDGNTTPVTIGGRDCRVTADPGSDYFFYFDVSDSYAFQGSRPDVYVIAEYYDTGTSTITLDYDSNTGNTTPAIHKFGGGVTLTNTNTWRTAVFHVTDAYFGNRQNAGADCRLADINHTFYLDRVWVTTQAPLSPVVDGVASTQITYPGIPYSQQLTLTQANPLPTWSLLQGPPGATVSVSGLVSGWTPGIGDLGEHAIRVQADNPPGSDTATWVVRVLSRSDYDLDGDVDQADFGFFQACLAGSGTAIAEGCVPADLDGDGDVDGNDFALLQPCMAGTGRSPGC
jgi:hypothetical protein